MMEFRLYSCALVAFLLFLNGPIITPFRLRSATTGWRHAAVFQVSSAHGRDHNLDEGDKFVSKRFHHIEFYAGDATSTYRRFMHAVGLELVSKSDFSTGNTYFNSYLLQSGQVRMLFTAPYDAEREMLADGDTERIPFPYYNPGEAAQFFIKHGLSVRAIGIVVANVSHAFETMVANGASPGLGPHKVIDQRGRGWCEMAEIKLYGDVVVRLVGEDHFEGAFLPNFEDIRPSTEDGHGGAGVGRYGIERFDHIVGNVWSLPQTLSYMRNITVSAPGCSSSADPCLTALHDGSSFFARASMSLPSSQRRMWARWTAD